jgi:ketosteroid isomerase-like protein
VAASAAFLTPDSISVTKGFGMLSGTRDLDASLAGIGALKDIIPAGIRPDIKSVTAEGDHVVVEFEGNAKLVNGVDYCNQYCFVFTMRDGKIAESHEYFCSVLADKTLGALFTAAENAPPH